MPPNLLELKFNVPNSQILHITKRDDWESRPDHSDYRAPSLETEGFIHCSTPEQVLKPANAFYRGEKDLVLLCIDAERVTSEIRYEDCYDTGEKYPHIYGPLNTDAVYAILDFPPNEDGTFTMPTLP